MLCWLDRLQLADLGRSTQHNMLPRRKITWGRDRIHAARPRREHRSRPAPVQLRHVISTATILLGACDWH